MRPFGLLKGTGGAGEAAAAGGLRGCRAAAGSGGGRAVRPGRATYTARTVLKAGGDSGSQFVPRGLMRRTEFRGETIRTL